MSNDWERLTDLFEAAVAREPAERSSFVRKACGDDSDLRRQVEAMLAEVDQPAVIDRPVDEAIADLLGDDRSVVAGTQLGPYRVESLLGVGGMGEVYRAHDIVLGREVAIKILPADLSADPERLARFEREARILASLNHPQIAAIFAVEKSAGWHALVMELVEGEDLAQRLARGAIPVDEALPIARQIAEALEAAHEQGIIHRDLKPANIKVRPDGTVKVLDFGLAKAMEPVASAPNVTASPTLTSPAMMTGVGVILGTAAYMSPEQAKGRPADKRSDIWAFGCVLYEMLTGKRPFDGEDMTEVLGAVVRLEPNWDVLPSDVSQPIRTLLRRCLVKDRRTRIADIAAALFVLDHQADAASTVRQPPRARWRRIAALSASAVTAGILSGAVVWIATRPAPPRVTRFTLSPAGEGRLSIDPNHRDLTVAPDGTRIIYVGLRAQGSALFVRPIDQLEPTLLVGNGAPREPFPSPDGQWIGFIDIAAGSPVLKKVAVTGGSAQTLCAIDGLSFGATWGDDGSIIFATGNSTTGLQQVSSGAGTPRVLTTPDHARGERDHLWPQFLPGGQAVLFTITSNTSGMDASTVAVLDLQTGVWKVLVSGGSQAHYTPSGHLVYSAAGTLFAVAFDVARLEVLGTPTPVLPQVMTLRSGTTEFSIARDGTLIYVPADVSPTRTLVWVDRQGHEQPVKGVPARAYTYPRLSPDGAHLALGIRDQENDIWVWDFARESLRRLTFDPGRDESPVWMPGGRRIVFGFLAAANASGNRLPALSWLASDGTGTAERLGTEESRFRAMLPSSVSPDGTRIVAWSASETAAVDVMMLTLSDRRLQPLIQTPSVERNGEISPDGRWLAYESNASGRFQIYVRPFPDVDGGLWQVSSDGGTQPLWARNGEELFYVTPDRTLSSVRVEHEPTWPSGTLGIRLDRQYFLGSEARSGRMYDVSADGRFLMIKDAAADQTATPATIVVVQNWHEELKRLVPTP